jgi:hypothetical protein
MFGVLLGLVLLFGALGEPAAALVLGVACSLTVGLVVGLFSPLPATPEPSVSRLRGSLIGALQGWLLVAPLTGVAALCAGLASGVTSPISVGIEVGSVCGMSGVLAGLLLGRPAAVFDGLPRVLQEQWKRLDGRFEGVCTPWPGLQLRCATWQSTSKKLCVWMGVRMMHLPSSWAPHHMGASVGFCIRCVCFGWACRSSIGEAWRRRYEEILPSHLCVADRLLMTDWLSTRSQGTCCL